MSKKARVSSYLPSFIARAQRVFTSSSAHYTKMPLPL